MAALSCTQAVEIRSQTETEFVSFDLGQISLENPPYYPSAQTYTPPAIVLELSLNDVIAYSKVTGDPTGVLSGKAVDLFNWVTAKADVEQMMLEAMSEKSGVEVEQIVLMGKMLGIDEAIAYAKAEAFEIAKGAEKCAEYTLASRLTDFLANGKECIKKIEADINIALEDAAYLFFTGKWLKDRPYDAFMHLIEYDLDNNVDEDDKRRVLWETMLGRNDFCINVKLLNMIL